MFARITSTVVLAAAVFAATASADDLTVQLDLQPGGPLALSHDQAAVTATSLDGLDQIVTYTMPLTVTDSRSNGVGWKLTVTSTTFVTPEGAELAADASSITSIASGCAGTPTCTVARNRVRYPIALPAGTTAPPAVKFFNAQRRSGMGSVAVTPTVSLAIPGNAYAGVYESTVVVALNTGP